jgi:putative transposase
VCRKHGEGSATFYKWKGKKWKGKFGGLGVSEVKRLRALEDAYDQLTGCWPMPYSTTPR